MEVTWFTGECSVRQRTTVRSRVNEGTEQNIGDSNKIINSFLSTDRQTDRTNELRIRIISSILHRP